MKPAGRIFLRGILAVWVAFALAASSAAAATITIATFNIQNFGKTKAKKISVMRALRDIIKKFDVVAVQEVSDSSEAAPRQLLSMINADGSQYNVIISSKTGMQANDKSSQEQYAYYFNSAKIEQLGQAVVFDDSEQDLFQREPYIARFKAKSGNFTFVLISIHTAPQKAVEEIGALHDVILWARGHFSGESDFIALGDFNAGCSYASPAKLGKLTIRGKDYLWIVPDGADSNLAKSRCAYDRIVTTLGTQQDFTGAWEVGRFFTNKKVSDHWPVWAKFEANRDSD